MHIVFVTDIFGQHAGLDEFIHACRSVTFSIIDPYQARKLNFIDEEEAYQTFLSQCGHHAYTQLIAEKIKQLFQPSIFVGFSAGASATWQALGENHSDFVQQFIGFYPSQIRHHLHLIPNVSTVLFFPVQEKYFSVDDVLLTLSEKSKVQCVKTNYQHGFLNPLSLNFDQASSLYFAKKLSKIIN
jgi:dienelactone hydrolase